MKAILCVVCLCSLVLVVGCGGDGGGPSDTAASLTAAGWALFEKGEYDQAIGKFTRALGLDPEYADAYNGLGWSHAKLDSLRNSLDNFGMCIAEDNTLADPFAGCAAVYRDYKVHPDSSAEYDSALVSASNALAKEGSYSFDHDTSFNWQDLHLIMAQSHYGLGEFLQAKEQVDALGGHALDPESPTFVEDLAEEIERLEGLYGG
jgi:tetratricopeptide (TPR) repeat protein